MHPTWVWSTLLSVLQLLCASGAYILGFAEIAGKAVFMGAIVAAVIAIILVAVRSDKPFNDPILYAALAGAVLALGIPTYDTPITILGFALLGISALRSVKETRDGPWVVHLFTIIPFGIGPVCGYIFMRRS